MGTVVVFPRGHQDLTKCQLQAKGFDVDPVTREASPRQASMPVFLSPCSMTRIGQMVREGCYRVANPPPAGECDPSLDGPMPPRPAA